MLCYVLDFSDDLIKNLEILQQEVLNYKDGILKNKKGLVVVNKSDSDIDAESKFKILKEHTEFQ